MRYPVPLPTAPVPKALTPLVVGWLFVVAPLLLGSGAARAQAHPGQEAAGRIAAAGDRFGPAVVTRVEIHPEFERIHLEIGGAPPIVLPAVEVVALRPGREGMCAHQGLTAFPRWDLAGERPWPVDPEEAWHEGERAPQNPEEEAFAAVCAAMEVSSTPPQVVARTEEPAVIPVTAPPPPAPWWLAWLVGAALCLGGMLAAAVGLPPLRERALRRELLGLTLVALVARAVVGPWTVFNGGGAAWEKLLIASGARHSPALYGDGWALLHQAAALVAGRSVGTILALQFLLSVLAVPALYGLLRGLHGGLVARYGALSLAVLPLALWLSSTEVMTGPTLTLLLLAGACAVAPGALAGAAAGLLAGAAVHTRPEALLFLPALAALPLAARGRGALRDPGAWLALLLGGGLALARITTLPDGDSTPLDLGHLSQPMAWLAFLKPTHGATGTLSHVALDLRWSSPVLWLALPVALWRAPARLRLLPWALWLLPTAILATKSWPIADALRLQLLVAPAWCAVVAVAAAGLSARLALPVAALVALPLVQGGPDFPRQSEWLLLREGLPRVPQERVLRYVDAPRAELRAQVAAPDRRWIPLSAGPVHDGEILLIDVACFTEPTAGSCLQAMARCRWHEEKAGITAPLQLDLDLTLSPGARTDHGMRLQLVELSGCEVPSDTESAPGALPQPGGPPQPGLLSPPG